MAFAKRILSFKFELGQGDFGDGASDTVELTGIRASVNVSRAGGNSTSNAELRIWGMPLSTMNKLTVLNVLAYPELRNNRVTVLAGDEKSGTAMCFQGTIKEAWIDGSGAPDIMFHVSAFSSLFDLLKPVAPTSFKGAVDIALVLSGIAAQMGLSLENSGVTSTYENPYWPGTLDVQLRKICTAAHVNYFIDDVTKRLAVWPKNGSRDGAKVIVSPETGLVGYPTFTQQGCQFTTLYNPSLAFGRSIEVRSEFSAANGNWVIANVNHNLDAEIPGGQWFTEVQCTLLGHTLPIIRTV